MSLDGPSTLNFGNSLLLRCVLRLLNFVRWLKQILLLNEPATEDSNVSVFASASSDCDSGSLTDKLLYLLARQVCCPSICGNTWPCCFSSSFWFHGSWTRNLLLNLLLLVFHLLMNIVNPNSCPTLSTILRRRNVAKDEVIPLCKLWLQGR